MNRQTNRRRLFMAASTAAAAVVVGTVAAKSTEIGGTVEFEGGQPIPKGQIEISLKDGAAADKARGAPALTQMPSDGGAGEITFSLSTSEEFAASPTQQIVATLRREDGWLLARGSAQLKAGEPAEIVLYPVMY